MQGRVVLTDCGYGIAESSARRSPCASCAAWWECRALTRCGPRAACWCASSKPQASEAAPVLAAGAKRAAVRVAPRRDIPDEVLALFAAGLHPQANTGALGQTALARRAQLPGAQGRGGAGPIRRPLLAQFPPPHHPHAVAHGFLALRRALFPSDADALDPAPGAQAPAAPAGARIRLLSPAAVPATSSHRLQAHLVSDQVVYGQRITNPESSVRSPPISPAMSMPMPQGVKKLRSESWVTLRPSAPCHR